MQVYGKGRLEEIARRAVIVVAAFGLVALASPAPVLELASESRTLSLALPWDGGLVYSYRNSIYDAPVSQRLQADADGFRLGTVRSPDRRALEYYRWRAEPYADGDALALEPPEERVPPFALRVTGAGEQSIAAAGRTLVLREAFGEAVVQLRPTTASRLAWLVALVWR